MHTSLKIGLSPAIFNAQNSTIGQKIWRTLDYIVGVPCWGNCTKLFCLTCSAQSFSANFAYTGVKISLRI